MEWVNQATDFISQNFGQILLWLTVPTISGVSLWQLLGIIKTVFRKGTVKKYLKPIEEQYNTLKGEFDTFTKTIENSFREITKEYATNLQEQFNDLMLNYTNQKQEIYNRLVAEKKIVKNEIPNVKTIIAEEINKNTPNLNESEKVEELVEETENNEIKANNGDILL